ncbi:endonuclease/exonuclease/phosphatase family protein [uncultured Microscilla sp.]|uniref:endonuclease/exonuclease/phosphatase family protein n=1 Tax=uncultured Microscilla sp. TaxID=432653 RepID=UPI0026136A64|nr:endonuclease/exonuclease/phosphatase family protein [uncultured Microscilla sp.]
MRKFFKWFMITVLVLTGVFFTWVYLATYHPKAIQKEQVTCGKDAPTLKAGQSLKVLSWNVQYMAGKGYVFFYDLLDNSGPDTRPSKDSISLTIKEVARIITQEDPDIILLQEIDEGAARTDKEDQLKRLLGLINKAYQCHCSAFYWKASFVPDPHVMGSVGMKLSTISKYKISEGVRHQLPLIPQNFLVQQFYLKRAVLETKMPVEGNKDLLVLNTHLSAFAQGTKTMEQQVAHVNKMLKKRTKQGHPWLLGGDFNLLPVGNAYRKLPEYQKKYYKPKTEIASFFNDYQAVPNIEQTRGENRAEWFTHFPNDPRVKQPDRTIDYIFFSKNIDLRKTGIGQKDTWSISDHLPLMAEFSLK